jgi:hypothetical protein
MGGAALASVLHVAGHPLPSHHCPPIAIVQLPPSNCHPQIAIVVFINIVAIGGSSGIIAIAVSISVAIAVAISTTAIVAIIVKVALLTLLCQRRFISIIFVMLLGGQLEELDQTTPQRHCPWHVDGAPTLGLAAQGLAALTRVLDVVHCQLDAR